MPAFGVCGDVPLAADARTRKKGISADQAFDVPESFTQLCDRFFGLDLEQRDAFLNAAFWLQHATRVHRLSRSAYFTALISAIEALLPDPARGRTVRLAKGPQAKGQLDCLSNFANNLARRMRRHGPTQALWDSECPLTWRHPIERLGIEVCLRLASKNGRISQLYDWRM
jgi:hypothetical protein